MTDLAVIQNFRNPLQPKIDSNKWRPEEIATLRSMYPQKGAIGCVQHIPGRSAAAIHQKARTEGLSAPIPDCKKLTATPNTRIEYIDGLIRAHYAGARTKGSLVALASKIGRGHKWIYARAVMIGALSEDKRRNPWTSAEKKIVNANLSLGLHGIQKKLADAGFKRSIGTIKANLYRNPPDEDIGSDVMTGAEIARLMGVSPPVVYRWIERHGLKVLCRREGVDRAMYTITRKALKSWIAENPALINLGAANKIWLIDLLVN